MNWRIPSKEFFTGDRVKMRDQLAAAYIKRKHRVNWAERRGTVQTASMTNVVIVWDDRKSADQWPPAALEKI